MATYVHDTCNDTIETWETARVSPTCDITILHVGETRAVSQVFALYL